MLLLIMYHIPVIVGLRWDYRSKLKKMSVLETKWQWGCERVMIKSYFAQEVYFNGGSNINITLHENAISLPKLATLTLKHHKKLAAVNMEHDFRDHGIR